MSECSLTLTWESGVFTDPGLKRKHNEDAYLNRPDQGLWAVADGMGGHHSGDLASQTVVAHLSTISEDGSLSARATAIENALMQANQDLQETAAKEQRKVTMGSTVAGLLHHAGINLIFWAGDSRVYRIRAGKIQVLSEDHSMVQMMVLAGELRPEDAETHPGANMILRAVGGEEALFVDWDYDKPQAGDRYLLCSDGLFKDLAESSLQTFATLPDLHEALNAMKEAALDAGGSDNITAIMVEFYEARSEDKDA